MKPILVLLIGAATLSAQLPNGEEIVDLMLSVFSPSTSKGVMAQTITTTSGKQRRFEFEIYSAGKGSQSLLRYRKPAAVRGQTFLMLNNANDIWAYFPRTKRVRKLASHAKKQKLQGSDFTYEDLGSGEAWQEDYQSTNLGAATIKGIKCWRIESAARAGKEPSYPRLVLLVRQQDYYPIQIDYYLEDGTHQKTLILEDIRRIEDLPTAMLMTMQNHRDGTETRMETLSISYRWVPPAGFFSERNLKQ